MSIWVTADLHLSHKNIIVYSGRPFLNETETKEYLEKVEYKKSLPVEQQFKYRIKINVSQQSIDEHDNTVINNINKYVKRTDILYIGGDCCFPSHLDVAKKFRDRINCENINLVIGNHDKPKYIHSVFNKCKDIMEFKVGEQFVVMSHYAMVVWNKSHHGSYNFYGHSHSSLEEFMDKTFPNRKSIDVGIDNAYKIVGEYRPFHFNELDEIMKSKSEYIPLDHHK